VIFCSYDIMMSKHNFKNGGRFLCFSILIERISYIFVCLVWPWPPARPPAHPSAKHNFKNGVRFLCFCYYDMMIFWYYDILILWYYDIMILCYYDMMLLWHYDIRLLWYYDIMILWYFDIMILCYYDIMIGLPGGARSRQAQRFTKTLCRTELLSHLILTRPQCHTAAAEGA